jgi:hypothetical protein
MTFNQPFYLGELLQALWNALNPRGYLVSIAVHVHVELMNKRYDIPRMVNQVSFINVVRENFKD